MKTGNCKSEARYRSFVLLLVLPLTLTSCSSLTNFVVVNGSTRALEVRYKVKKVAQPVSPIQLLPIRPAIKPIAQLEHQTSWRDLSISEFTFDPDSRTVIVSLMPGDALRIEQRNLVDAPKDDASQASNFGIEEIVLDGANGVAKFEGDLARRSFVPQSGKTYILTYK